MFVERIHTRVRMYARRGCGHVCTRKLADNIAHPRFISIKLRVCIDNSGSLLRALVITARQSRSKNRCSQIRTFVLLAK